MAILTAHTVHIAILPEPSHLTAPDTAPMRIKAYLLGPTTHVTSQSAIASALWHPLGVNGSSLVTVTKDAVVRVWELSTADRWSFDRPTLAIDLQKLADGTTLDQDFGASTMKKGFSPDSFEMEVASACFAGRGSGGWSPMTLWIAMREGDVYALCPLLPEKWSPPPTLIPSLSVSIVAKVAAMEDDPSHTPQDKRLAQQQLAWMSDIDVQEPTDVETAPGEPTEEVYMRPGKPGRVPKLQGPFEFELAPDPSRDESLDTMLSDIYVIGTKIDSDQLMDGEEYELENDEDQAKGLSVGVICLLTSSGRLSICLDIDGVEAQWLPKSKSKVLRFVEEADPPALLTFQTLDTLRDSEVWEGNWPMFSHDFYSRYSFFVTNTSSITYISLSPWAFGLENELNGSSAGADFRIDILAKQGSIRERIHSQKMQDHTAPLAACEVTSDPDLGYQLLSATPYAPLAITFERPEAEFDMFRRSPSPTYDEEYDKPLVLYEPRQVYEPARALEMPTALPSLIEKLKHSKYKRLLNEEVRLSPATLSILTDAHKLLSEETLRLGTAAAELFRKCTRLQVDLKQQIQKANEVASRVEAVTGDDITDGAAQSSGEIIEERLALAKRTQEEINTRLEKVRKRIARGSSRELSHQEKAWFGEVKVLEKKVLGVGAQGGEADSNEPWARYEKIEQLKGDLLRQASEIPEEDEELTRSSVKVPSEIRRAKMGQIMNLLDRETALVEGAKSRLEKLSLT
jgi:nucleoporin NUP82